MPNTPKIEVCDARKVYASGQAAVQGIRFEVMAGEIFGFLGPNGAGKTTTIKMLLGFFPPTEGAVRVCGGDPVLPETRRSLGYLPEVANYYEFLSAVELLTFYGNLSGLRGGPLRSRIDEILETVGLADTGRKPIRNFSKGMRQRVGLAQAILHDPDVLILDEPLTGLDPIGRRQVRDIIRELRERGKTIFFSSHELSEAEMVSDRVAILNAGHICWSGPLSRIAGHGDKNLERVFLEVIENDNIERSASRRSG